VRPTTVERAPAILYEKSGYWAAGLRAALAARDAALGRSTATACDLVELRSLADLDAAIAAGPARVVVLELTAANAPRVLDAVARHRRESPQLRAVVVGKPELRCWEPALWWAGVCYLTTTVRRLGPVIELMLRLPTLDPKPVSIQEQAWRSLPWSRPAQPTDTTKTN